MATLSSRPSRRTNWRALVCMHCHCTQTLCDGELLDMACELSSLTGFPKSLFEQSLRYLIENLDCFLKLKKSKSLSLPSQIWEALFDKYQLEKNLLTQDFLSIFENLEDRRLRRITLIRECACPEYLTLFLHQNLEKLDVREIRNLPYDFISCLNKNGNALKEFSCNYDLFQKAKIYFLNTPNLEKLVLRYMEEDILSTLIPPLKNLRHLHLLNINVKVLDFSFLLELPQLLSLKIQNVHITQNGFTIIRKLCSLQQLDISHFRYQGIYEKPFAIITSLIQSLPNLISLDISGTNLYFREALELRRNSPLEFLGLLHIIRPDIEGVPAKHVAVNVPSTIKQFLVAGFENFENPRQLEHLIFNILPNIPNASVEEHYSLIEFCLNALNRYPSLLTSFQYFLQEIVPVTRLTINVNRYLIASVLKAGMRTQFKIIVSHTFYSLWTAEDLFFDIKLIKEFLKSNLYVNERFMGSILRRAYRSHKESLAQSGLLEEWLQEAASPVSIYYWHCIWLLVRNDYKNSVLFVEKNGIDIMKNCILLTVQTSKYWYYNIRSHIYTLMILINLTQYEGIVSHLMDDVLIDLLLELLKDYSNIPEVRYYSGCMLLQLILHATDKWTDEKHKRKDILNSVTELLKIADKLFMRIRFIEKDLFQLVLSLFEAQNIPECIYWAVWGIARVPGFVQKQYFSSSGGGRMKLLNDIVETDSSPDSVKKIAEHLIKKWFKL